MVTYKNSIEPDENVVVICTKEGPSPWDDNVRGHCAICGCAVMWRPHMPEPSVKLCFDCGEEEINDAEAGGEEIVIAATDKQRAEVESLYGPGALDRALEILERHRKAKR